MRIEPVGKTCDSAGDALAVGRDPTRHQPFRRVEGNRIERRQTLGAFARHAAEHGIDQTGMASGVTIRLHQTDGKIDGGMIGHVEEKNLRRADQERGLGARRLLRQATLDEEADQMAQRAKPPQYRSDQTPHQSAVAVRERDQAGMRSLAG